MKNQKYTLPDILLPELRGLEKCLDKACDWVVKNEKDIHSSISFIDAVKLYNF